ncbi:oxygenase MpaB family protein [Streptomyces sp. NPDC051985]|uniref:oxygenase MpaB family protein n=1 Tax=Streptomyces sp. NPDC051985 TaxID=3155807 RepID=UPI00343BFC7D
MSKSSADFIPERVVNLDAARLRYGAKADRMAEMATVGDPLADAVIAELDELGKEGRRILNAGLEAGLAQLGEEPPPGIKAFLDELEAVPSWVDPEMLDRGEVVTHSVPGLWFEIAMITSALTHTYSSPAIARLLVQTGQLTKMAPRRLIETGLWTMSATQPGGLHRGAAGYIATAQVRLLHARVRASALKHSWDSAVWGTPISQVDVARTWLDFTLTPSRAFSSIGIDFTLEEQQQRYAYWSYLAYLLGLDPFFYQDIKDDEDGGRLQDLLDSTTAPPDDDARALTGAMIEAQSESLAMRPDALMDKEQYRDLVHGLLRRTFGDEHADRLGIPRSAVAHMLPVVSLMNNQSRRWQTFTPESKAAALAENASGAPTPELMEFLVPGGTAYARNINESTPA